MAEKPPYFNSKTQPHLAINRIKKTLEKFGSSQMNFGQDFERKEIRVNFINKKIPVCLPVSYGKLGQLYKSADGPRCRSQETYLKMGENAAYAVIAEMDADDDKRIQ